MREWSLYLVEQECRLLERQMGGFLPLVFQRIMLWAQKVHVLFNMIDMPGFPADIFVELLTQPTQISAPSMTGLKVAAVSAGLKHTVVLAAPISIE